MSDALKTYILENMHLLKQRDFILEILTACKRRVIPDDMIVTEKNEPYVGKLYTKDNVVYALKAYLDMGDYRYKITEMAETDIPSQTKAYFSVTDTIDIPAGVPANNGGKITTTVGRLILNYLLLAEPFGDKFPYINGPMQVQKINDSVFTATMERQVTAEQLDTYTRHLYFIGHMPEVCVPNYTRKSLTTDPNIAKRRKELVEENREALEKGDPIVMAQIERELIQMDQDYLKGDPSEIYYGNKKGKAFGVQRKKSLVVGGMFGRFGSPGKFDFIEKPLGQGIEVKDFTVIANEIRGASYSRAMETVDGGVVAKMLMRSFQNTRIIEEDCGDTRGVTFKLTAENARQYTDRWILENGALVNLTKDNVKARVGKSIVLRDPMSCQTHGGFCMTCMGTYFKTLDQRSLVMRSMTMSQFLLTLSLKKSHGDTVTADELPDLDEFVI